METYFLKINCQVSEYKVNNNNWVDKSGQTWCIVIEKNTQYFICFTNTWFTCLHSVCQHRLSVSNYLGKASQLKHKFTDFISIRTEIIILIVTEVLVNKLTEVPSLIMQKIYFKCA